jgi:hypothetical protein
MDSTSFTSNSLLINKLLFTWSIQFNRDVIDTITLGNRHFLIVFNRSRRCANFANDNPVFYSSHYLDN